MTAGLEVFVQDVIAAMTTEPWSSSKLSPFSVTCAAERSASTTRGLVDTSAPPSRGALPGAESAGGSLAGNDSATASSCWLP